MEVWVENNEILLKSEKNKHILAIISMEEYVKMKEEIAQLQKELSLDKS